MMITRREFLDAMAVGAAGLAVGTTAKSYGQILGSNDRLNFAVIGLNGRAYAHLASLKANKSAARISHVCDVDGDILKKFADKTQQEMGETPVTEKDFRKILEQKNVDAITIATPDHWHTPMAIDALKAGKHVYVENRAATIPPRERCWCRRSRSIRSSYKWARSSALPHIRSRSSRKSTAASLAGLTTPRPGTPM